MAETFSTTAKVPTTNGAKYVQQLCIDASAEGQRDGLKGALASHLDRFAFREAPLTFHWQDA